MKKFVHCLFLSFFSVFAQNNQELFLQANQAYENGEIDKALTLYEKIPQKGSAIWHNLGACYYKQDNIVDAVVCFRRAQKQASPKYYAIIEQAIDHIAKDQGIEITKKGWRTQLFLELSKYYSLLFWQVLFILLWVLVWFLGFSRQRNLLTLIISLSSLVITGNVVVYKMISDKKHGVIKENTSLFVGPNEGFAKQENLKKCQEVVICEKHDRWYKVEVNKKIGWIQRDAVLEI